VTVLFRKEIAELHSDLIEIRDATFENNEPIGKGLFVKAGSELRPGDLITEYPGVPRWKTTHKAKGYVGPHQKYIFVLGPFVVLGGRGPCKRCIVWEIDSAKTKLDIHRCAHLVNTYTPRSLHPGYRSQNCCWAFDVSGLQLDCRIKPNITLYLVATTYMRGSGRSSQSTQLLADYHWFLAYERGIWCSDSRCTLCIEGLDAYIQRDTQS
jgi:hypothetical protein